MSRLGLSGIAVAALLTVPANASAVEVVATIKPVHSLVAAVMQGVDQPHLIVRGDGSPHSYSLRPSDAAALDRARVVFWVGPGLETFLEDPLRALAGRATIVALGEAPGVAVLPQREGGPFESHDSGAEAHEGEKGEHEHEKEGGHEHQHGAAHADSHDHDHDHDHHHDGGDPHVWLDPLNAKAMAAVIADTLAAADPQHAGAYRANAAALAARLDALVAAVHAGLASVRGKPFVVFHDAYQYFEHRFDMHAVGSLTVTPEVAPGARRLVEVRDKIRDLGAVCAFAEPQFEPRLINVVTEGTPAGRGVLDPLGAALPDGPGLYETLIRDLAASLKSCLAASG